MFILGLGLTWVIFWIVCAAFAAALANARGRSALGWFLLGVLFGPFALLVGLFPVKEPVVRMSRNSKKYRTQLGYTDDSDQS